MRIFKSIVVIALTPAAAVAQGPQPARIAESAAGTAGERQTAERVAEEAGIEPMARLDGRIRNRVENRLRNRIDQNYDPAANALSPFENAADRQRDPIGRQRR